MKKTLRFSFGLLCSIAFYSCSTSEPIACYLPSTTATSNSPLITGGSLQLTTPAFGDGASYLWTGPNNFQSNVQNPVVTNVTPEMSGDYKVKVVRGICESPETFTTVEITSPSIPCNPNNNTMTFTGGFSSINFNSVYSSTSSGEYEIRAGASNADLTITFANANTPTPGVYQISGSCPTSFLTSGQVCVSLNYLSYTWANSGSVYITNENGNLTARFCSVVFQQSGVTLNSSTKLTVP